MKIDLTTEERNLSSTQWVEYHNGTKRKSYNTPPTSDITAEAVSVDGFTLSQADNAGESTSTSRSLAIQLNGTWYPAPTRLASQGARSQVCSRLGVWLLKSQPAYGWELTKNICEVYGKNGYISTSYTYSPYGEVTTNGNTSQPIQWSSEYNDVELGQAYYNYRHYNPVNGRWLGRDKKMYNNLYKYTNNSAIALIDILVLKYILKNTPSILDVPKWALPALGSFVIRRGKQPIPGVDFKPYLKLLQKVIVPDVDITGTIKLVTDDEVYTETLFYLIESKININLSIKEVKEYIKEHEMNHFKQYRSRMLPYISFANSLDSNIICEAGKLKKYLDAYLNDALAQYYADGAELDVQDYFGPAKVSALRIRSKRYADLLQNI